MLSITRGPSAFFFFLVLADAKRLGIGGFLALSQACDAAGEVHMSAEGHCAAPLGHVRQPFFVFRLAEAGLFCLFFSLPFFAGFPRMAEAGLSQKRGNQTVGFSGVTRGMAQLRLEVAVGLQKKGTLMGGWLLRGS